MLLPKVSELEKAFIDSWCRETSSLPKSWRRENNAWGQCAVTALVLQDYFGGDLLNCEVTLGEGFYNYVKRIDSDLKNPVSHYLNNVEGKIIDLTRKQFPLMETIISRGVFKPKDFESTRQYTLSSEKTVERYEILKRKVEKFLTGRK
ncbi:MAG TPA: hypothetical protein VJ208_02920 [Candidatus Nanoarchaeia archaeon]|nr:hypothetical protein [Candidatus Nanoarchaeia archaeon]